MTLTHNLAAQREALHRATVGAQLAIEASLVPLGRTLTRLAQDEFRTLSARQRAGSGRQWSERRSLRDRQRPLGVLTGNLRDSLRLLPITSRRGQRFQFAVLAYTAPHAWLFNRLRRLLPRTLPRTWREQLEPPLQQTQERIRQLLLHFTSLQDV